ncbi:MAG: D-aminoacylase [Longimicrobiales bacterium]|nr:D-aminoacylase [Longimicrobiales bacterium]
MRPAYRGREWRRPLRRLRRLAALAGALGIGACAAGPGGSPEAALPAVPGAVPDGAWDVLLAGGRLVDGTGNPWRYADVAIRGDRIAAVLPAGTADARRARAVLDVSGLVVAPGFVDINGQGDTGLLADGRALNKLHMGVTTELMGESNTPAPVNARTLGPVDPADTTAVRRARDWTRFGAWLEEMEAGGVALNVGSFLGGTTVRRYAMGMREGAPDAAALDTMRAVTRRAMEEGALGVATALIYPPGAYAGTGELVEVARAVARHGGVYISHIRSESAGLLGALDEAIEIGRRSGAPVEIYHLKAAGVANWPLQGVAVQRIEAARAAGVDVQAALYPYTAASTSLQACLPPWSAADGRLRERLRDPGARARMAAEMTAPAVEWENWCALSTPAGAMIVGVSRHENRALVGKTLADLAEARGRPWAEAVLDLLVEEGNVGMVYFAMDEANVRDLLRQPWIKFGSDAGVWDPARAEGMTHPRAYGTYPRILGRYVREEGVLTLEDAVRKMTSAVADRVGLAGRGTVRAGYYADLVVFDAETVAETATFTDPHRLARGVVHLFVNGTAVLRDGAYTGARPGRFLRGPGARR